MRMRYWLLLAGSVIAIVALTAHQPNDWADFALLFAGALVGVWAFEGVRDRVEQRGGRVDPL